MKTYQEILDSTPDFGADFVDGQDVYELFQYSDSDKEKLPEDITILFARHLEEYYDSSAIVIFRKNSELYEVHGSHCSCYGFEEQWCPEPLVLKELEHRMIEGCTWYEADLKHFLEI